MSEEVGDDVVVVGWDWEQQETWGIKCMRLMRGGKKGEKRNGEVSQNTKRLDQMLLQVEIILGAETSKACLCLMRRAFLLWNTSGLHLLWDRVIFINITNQPKKQNGDFSIFHFEKKLTFQSLNVS